MNQNCSIFNNSISYILVCIVTFFYLNLSSLSAQINSGMLSSVQASFTASNSYPYMGETVEFTNTTPEEEGLSFEWQIDGFTYSTERDFTKYFHTTGEYRVTLKVKKSVLDFSEANQDFVIKRNIVTNENKRKGIIFSETVNDLTTGITKQKPIPIFDRFGNQLTLSDISIPNNSAQAGIFVLHFYDQDNNTNVGFDDPAPGQFHATIGEDRREVLIQVYEDISRLLSPTGDLSGLPNPYPGDPTDRSIEIDIRSGTDWNGNAMPANALAAATQFYLEKSSGISYGEVWKSINTGMDSYAGLSSVGQNYNGHYHGAMTFNFTAYNWYLNLNDISNISHLEYDLYSVALHETMHLLGFASLLGYDGQGSNHYQRYSPFDVRLNTSSTALIESQTSCYDYTFSGDESTVKSGCNTIYYSGNGNTNNNQVVYSPNNWQQGSSLSHFNCNSSSGCPYNGNGYVMNFCSNLQEVQRTPHIAEIETLCDLGYNVQNTIGNGEYSSSTKTYSGFLCTSLNQISGANDFRPFSNDNQSQNFEIEHGESIIFSDFGTHGLLENDFNANAYSCVDVVIGGNLSNLIVSGNTIEYNPPSYFSGIAILKYRPINSQGVKGNTAYVYIRVNPKQLEGCAELVDCHENLVCHGSFEDIVDNYVSEISDFKITPHSENWSPNSPDLFIGNLMYGWKDDSYSICAATDNPYPFIGNKYILVGGTPDYREGVTLPLNTLLLAGETYKVTFRAHGIGNVDGCPSKLEIYLSENPPCSFSQTNDLWDACGSFSPILSFNKTVIDYSNWLLYSSTVTIPSNSQGANYIILTATTETIQSMHGSLIDDVQVFKVSGCPIVSSESIHICEEESAQLGVSTSGFSNPTFQWFPSTGLDCSICQNPIATPSETTEYVVTVSDANNSNTASTVVYVTPKPEFSINTSSLYVCQPDTVLLTVTGIGLDENTTYSWAPATGLSCTNCPNPKAYISDDITYSVKVQNECFTLVDNITIYRSVIDVDAGLDQFLCIGESADLGGVPTATGNKSPFSYLWSTNNESIVNPDNLSNLEVTPQVSTIYTVKVTDAVGCEASDNVSIDVGAELSVDAGEDKFCWLGEATLGGNNTASGGSGSYTYVWTANRGADPEDIEHPKVTPTITTTYTVQVTDINGCGTGTDQVQVIPQLIVDAGSDLTVCGGEGVQINAISSPESGYYWEPATGLSCTDCKDPIASPNIKTTYRVVVFTEPFSCQGVDSITVMVSDNPQVSTADKTLTICKGESPRLFAIGDSEWQYVWSPRDFLSCGGLCRDPWASPPSTTLYKVYATNEYGCQGVDSTSIIVNENPDLDLGTDKELCTGSSTRLIGYTYGATAYSWSPTMGLNCTTCANPWASPSETTEYCLEIIDDNGCTATDCITVTVNPLPVADAGEEQYICYGNCTSIGGYPVATEGTPGYTYSWSSGSIYSNPIECPTSTTTYTVTVTDSKGCQDSDNVKVNVAQPTEYIQNGGFESGTIPEWRGELDLAHTNNVWFASAGGPDLFDKEKISCLPAPLPNFSLCDVSPLDINCVDIPCNHFGYQEHRLNSSEDTGRYAGLYFALNVSEDIQHNSALNTPVGTYTISDDLRFVVEGIEQELSQPLVIGQRYCMNFFASLAENGEVSDLLVHDEAYYVVKLSTAESTSEGAIQNNLPPPIPNSLLPYTPAKGDVIFEGSINDITNWENVNFQFQADENYTHVIIESTYPEDLKIRLQNIIASNPDPDVIEKLNLQSYMYIDDVSIKELGCCATKGRSRLVADAGEDRGYCSASSNCVQIGGNPTADNGVAPYSYSWSDGSNVISTTSNPWVCPNGTATYTVTVTDATGDSRSSQVTITVDPANSLIELVPNGGFSLGQKPTLRNEIPLATNWTVATGTPDLFDSTLVCTKYVTTNDPNCVDIPTNYFGNQSHRTASNSRRYAGLYFAYPEVLNRTVTVPELSPVLKAYPRVVEGIQVKLNEKIYPGMIYKLTCYAAISDKGEVFREKAYTNLMQSSLSKQIDIVFKSSLNEVSELDHQPTNATLIKKVKVNKANGWQKIEFYFEAGLSEYLIIETFGGDGNEGYVYIDDVSILADCDNSAVKSQQITVENKEAIELTEVEKTLRLFPNPTSGELHLQLNVTSEETAYVQVYTVDAKLVSKKQTVVFDNKGLTTISLSHLPQGIYTVELIQGEQVMRERVAVH